MSIVRADGEEGTCAGEFGRLIEGGGRKDVKEESRGLGINWLDTRQQQRSEWSH